MSARLISSQRHLDRAIVLRKASAFKVFVVNVIEVTLRGTPYRVLVDGHHNLAAARLVGVEPTWRGAPKKLQRIMASTPKADFERFLINNLTDSDWYDVETGEVIHALLGIEGGRHRMTELTKTSIRKNGLKARVERLLTDNFPRDFSVAEICAALGEPKTESSAISSALNKLHVRSVTGPSTSTRGRRHTKRYRIVIKAAPAPIVVREMDDRRALAFTR